MMVPDTDNATPSPAWPPLPYTDWKATYATLHMWTQIVGKIRLQQAASVNHSWHVTLYATTRGLTTSPMPYGSRTFQIDFDFIDHRLLILTSDGGVRTLKLEPRSVADFYAELFARLAELDLDITINTKPNEVPNAIPFPDDHEHAAYDREHVARFWGALRQSDRVLNQFRTGFHGKSSPVHFFWGAFDLALTRFSGRPAPEHPGGAPNMPLIVAREAYSQEVSSIGFWPGNDMLPQAIYYAYAYPTPNAFPTAVVKPPEAAYNAPFGEFVLSYDAVRQAADPDAMLLDFAQSTYEAAADSGGWDRATLERTLFW